MCSRKWLMPFSFTVSKRDPTRAQRATYARWRCGCGETTTGRPLARTTLVLILFVAPARSAAVDMRFLHVRRVDLDRVLRLVVEPPDVERQRLVALSADQILLEGLAVLVEVFARCGLGLLELHDDEGVGDADRLRHHLRRARPLV